MLLRCFFFQAEDGIRDGHVTGVQTCALPISLAVLAFADQWRSFVWPLVATRSSEMQPLEVGIANLRGMRSEERRVGKECRSWWSADHLKKKTSVIQCGSLTELKLTVRLFIRT